MIGVVLFALVGFIFGNSAMLILSLLLLSVTVVAAALAWWNVRGLSVQVEAPARVHAGKRFELCVRLKNQRGVMDSVGIELRLDLAKDLQIDAEAGWIPTHGATVLELPVMAPHRDCVMALDYVLVSTFPFGLFSISRKGSQMMSPPLLVQPKQIIPRELLVHGALTSSAPVQGVAQIGEQGELKGIRPWRTGDLAKHIDWSASARSLARGHDLRVREYEPPGVYPEHCHLVFHSFGTGGAMLREDRFERALAFLAGSLQYLYSLGVKSTVHADFLGWHAKGCQDKAELIELLAILSQSERSVATEGHDLQQVMHSLEGGMVVISEIETELWSESLDVPDSAVLVDITQVNFKRNKTKHGKEVARA